MVESLMKFSASTALNAAAWIVIAVLIGVAMVVAEILG
jgi:hypothetical protein